MKFIRLKRIMSRIMVAALAVATAACGFEMNSFADYGATQISSNGMEIIKAIEGFNAQAYWDVTQWTIGYGNWCGDSKDKGPEKSLKLSDGTVIDISNGISKANASRLFADKIKNYSNYVKNFSKKYNHQFYQNQFDALVSFTYQNGNGWMSKESYNIFQYMSGKKSYNTQQLTDTFMSWDSSGTAGVVRRRRTELSLFLNDDKTPYEAWMTKSVMNMRKDATTSSSVVGSIKSDTVIIITDKKSAGGYIWGKCRYYEGDKSDNGDQSLMRNGWVALDYSTFITGSLNAIPTPTTTKPTTAKPTTAKPTTAKPTTAKPTTAKPTTVTTTAKPTTTTVPTTTERTTREGYVYPFDENSRLGDCNSDNKVDSTDILVLNQYIANIQTEKFDTKMADVNSDGVIDTVDALVMTQHLAGIEICYPKA